MKIDLTKLAPVSAHKRKPVNFDLRYRASSGKWQLSELAFARMDLNNMGFNLMLDPDGNVVFQLVPETDAQLMRRRGNATNKGSEFTSDSLRTLLDSKYSGVNDFRLLDLGTLEGTSFVGIEPWGSKEMTATVTTTVETIVEEDDEETTEMVDAVAAEAENATVTDDVDDIVPVAEQDVTTDDLDFSFDEEDEDEEEDDSAPELDLEDIPEPEPAEEPKAVKNPFNSF